MLSLLLAMGLTIGCDRRATTKLAPTGPVRTGTGVISGVVVLAGKPPMMGVIPNQPCHAGATPLKDESVRVDDAGHLRNVIVYLEDAPPAAAGEHLPAVVLDQVNCHYVPHVVALRTGQTLHVTTSDPAMHNVHGECIVNEAFNFALVSPGQSKDLTFSEPERFAVRCDVHPWMKAYVAVFAHPWFAVTGPDGAFQIKNVPPGSYTLLAWQEKYGPLRQNVRVSNDKITSATFTFQSGL